MTIARRLAAALVLPVLVFLGVVGVRSCSATGAASATDPIAFRASLAASTDGVVLESVHWRGVIDEPAGTAVLHRTPDDGETQTTTTYRVDQDAVTQREAGGAWVASDDDPEELLGLLSGLGSVAEVFASVGTRPTDGTDGLRRAVSVRGLTPAPGVRWLDAIVEELVDPAQVVWSVQTLEDPDGLARIEIRTDEPASSTGDVARTQLLIIDFDR